jgi:hypothetical protein
MSKAKQLNEKLKAFLESPQFVDPIDGGKLVEDTKSWLLKIFNAWERDPTSNVIKKIKNPMSKYPIFQIERIKHGSSRYNYIFQVIDNEVTFFSRYILVNNLKNLPKPSITQLLLWKKKNATVAMSAYVATKTIIFKITGSLLSDKQQTQDGHNAWSYIAERLGFEEGNHVGVYDSKDKKYYEFQDVIDFNDNKSKYYGKSEDFKRYQYVIYKD